MLTNFNNKYKYMAIPANYLSKPHHFDEAKQIYESESLLNFKLYKIDELHIRYLMEGISYEIKIIKDESYELYKVEKISEAQSNQNLFKYNTYQDLFYFNHNHLFHAAPAEDCTDSNPKYNL